ncbi:hypothetical protein GEU84_010370 [Fertoebacter nigrum]|uniref:50S ribosomal protein L35 n=1 Tax=Fertoeibacter niger TaxID=2656921 RepID=A0A8X8GZL5_9RHOB|nr:hypothetical protein [Fertoeibacter niger]NUB44788.1 hypothetical protein [Fertoeibacter niger]
MDTDLALVIGLLLGALAIPSILAALSDGRAPRLGAAFIAISAGMIGYALLRRPGGYAPGDVPMAFFNVLGRLLN